MCYSLRKRAGRIVFLNHPRCPCHAPNYDASCAAPRCAALNSGEEPSVRQAEEGEDSTARGLNNTVRLRLGLLMGFLSLPLSLPPVLEFLSPSSAATPRRACKARFPLVFFPPPVPLPPPPPTIPSATSQNLSLISAQLSGVSLSGLTAGGGRSWGGIQSHTPTYMWSVLSPMSRVIF